MVCIKSSCSDNNASRQDLPAPADPAMLLSAGLVLNLAIAIQILLYRPTAKQAKKLD